jgi:hypothetical protein
MVPFSYFQDLLNSWVMKKLFLSIEVWTRGAWDSSEAWRLHLDAFALSCLPVFLILIRGLKNLGFKPVLKGFKVI